MSSSSSSSSVSSPSSQSVLLQTNSQEQSAQTLEETRRLNQGLRVISTQITNIHEAIVSSTFTASQHTFSHEECEQDIQKLKEQISLLETEKEELSKEKSKLETTLPDTEKQVTEKTKKIEELEKLELPTETQKQEVEDLRREIMDLENRNKESIGKILLQAERIKNLEDDLQKMNDSKDEMFVKLTNTTATHLLKIRVLEEDKKGLQKKLEEALSKQSDLETRQEELTKRINEKETAIGELQGQLSLAKEDDVRPLMDGITNLKKDRDDLMIERDSVKDQLQKANEKIDSLKNDLNEKEAQNRSLKSENDRLKLENQQKTFQSSLDFHNIVKEFLKKKLAENDSHSKGEDFSTMGLGLPSTVLGAFVNPFIGLGIGGATLYRFSQSMYKHVDIGQWLEKNLERHIFENAKEFLQDKEKFFDRIVKEFMLPELEAGKK